MDIPVNGISIENIRNNCTGAKAYYFDFKGSFIKTYFLIIWLKPIPFSILREWAKAQSY
jgi:hypothetical protein